MTRYYLLFTVCVLFIFSNLCFAQNRTGNLNSVSFMHLVEKGDSLSSKGNYGSALLAYEEALKVEPDSFKIYNRLTKKYAFLGLFDEAQKRSRELFFKNKDLQNQEWLHLEGTCILGIYEAMQGDYKSAMNFNVIYIALIEESENYSSLNCAYRIHALAGYESEAIEQLEKEIKRKPQSIFPIWLTYLHKQKGNQQEANQLLEQLKKIRSMVQSGKILQEQEEGLIQYGLAMIAVLEKDKPKAIKHLRKSYEMGNKQYYWWKNLSLILREELEGYPEYQELLAQMKADIDQMREEFVQLNSAK